MNSFIQCTATNITIDSKCNDFYPTRFYVSIEIMASSNLYAKSTDGYRVYNINTPGIAGQSCGSLVICTENYLFESWVREGDFFRVVTVCFTSHCNLFPSLRYIM